MPRAKRGDIKTALRNRKDILRKETVKYLPNNALPNTTTPFFLFFLPFSMLPKTFQEHHWTGGLTI